MSVHAIALNYSKWMLVEFCNFRSLCFAHSVGEIWHLSLWNFLSFLINQTCGLSAWPCGKCTHLVKSHLGMEWNTDKSLWTRFRTACGSSVAKKFLRICKFEWGKEIRRLNVEYLISQVENNGKMLFQKYRSASNFWFSQTRTWEID